MAFLTFKVFHFIGLVSWFAGLFYIWRLFVYHSESESQDVKNTLNIMARKLYRLIMIPAMVITLTGGIGMLWIQWSSYTAVYWIWIKLCFVGYLIFHHHLANYYRKKLESGEKYPSRKFRIQNEIPTLVLIIAVILAVFKPF